MEATQTRPQLSIELKSGQFTLPCLRLLNTDMDKVADELSSQVSRSPGFFLNAPVVIDLGGLSEVEGDVDFALLVGLMRGNGMIPIGIQGGTQHHRDMAELMELAILSDGSNRQRTDVVEKPKDRVPEKPRAINRMSASKLVTRPVRSGQRVYAAGGDLVITSSVSSGAEVIADGNIHIYGALRGRALAGVKGNREARIFCQRLEAELIAVAGHYLVSESIPSDHSEQAVQVMLSGKSLSIESV